VARTEEKEGPLRKERAQMAAPVASKPETVEAPTLPEQEDRLARMERMLNQLARELGI